MYVAASATADIITVYIRKGANAKLMVEIFIVFTTIFGLNTSPESEIINMVELMLPHTHLTYAMHSMYIIVYLPLELVLALIKLWKMPLAK